MMKKLSILSVVCALSIGAAAQQHGNAPLQRVKAAQTMAKMDVPAMQYKGQMQKAPRHSIANGVHYIIPEGMIFPGWTEAWRYYAVSYIYTPAFYQMKFQNDCGNNAANAQWSMETASGTTYTHEQFVDWGNIDQGNSLVIDQGCYSNGYYVPTITLGSTSYRYGNLDPQTGKVMQNAVYNSFMVDTIDYKALSNTFTANMYGFGSLSSGYLFGTGSLTITNENAAEQYRGKTFVSDGLVQYYSKPASPLYIEKFFFPVFSSTKTPMAEGTSFVINFMKTAKNEEGEDSITNEIIKQFVVTKDNFFVPSPGEDNSFDSDYTSTKKAWTWNLILQEMEKDAAGNDVVVPFTIDSSFAIVVRGMNQEGIDVGFRAHGLDPDDVTHPCGCFGLDYDSEGLLYQHWYGNDMQLTGFFYGGFDYCEVLANYDLTDENGEVTSTLENINVLHVSADGQTVTNDNDDAQEMLEGCALLYTSYSWIDKTTGANNYEVEGGLPDWITDLVGNDLTDDDSNRTGAELITVKCKPLQAGQSGRIAVLKLHGKGYQSEQPLYIIQGDATIPTFSLSPAEFSIRKGESEQLSINLENEQSIIMAEFYMQLPQGITIATDEDNYLDATLNGDRTDRTHSLEVELGSDGLYHFLAYSNKNKPFIGNEGELVSMTLNCDGTVAGGKYQGVIKNILLSDANKQAINLGDITFEIKVTDYIPGDVNDDRRINGMDIVEMVELIMSQGYSKAADLYPVGQPDGKVNGMDLVEEVELVMSQPAQQAAQVRMANGLTQGLTLTPQTDGTLVLGVTTGQRYLMTQCLVQLGEGMRLDDVTTDAHHTAAWRDLGNGQYMVVAYSGSNQAFANNNALLSLHCTGEGAVAVTDVLMADELRQECRFATIQTGEVSGIVGISNEKSETKNDIYDLQGRVINSQVTVNHSPLKRGVYVVDGRKVVK